MVSKRGGVGAMFNLHLNNATSMMAVADQYAGNASNGGQDFFTVQIGTPEQHVTLFLRAEQVVQLAAHLNTWALAIQTETTPGGVEARDPQEDDELIDVREGE